MLLADVFFNIPLAISLHNIIRWVIVVLGFILIGFSLYGWLNKNPFYKLVGKISLVYSICIDLMLVLGVILWIWGSWGLKLLENSNFKAIMQEKEQRFFVLEHPLLMFIVLTLVHVGRIGINSNKISDTKKYKRVLLWNIIAYILIFLAIPWFRI